MANRNTGMRNKANTGPGTGPARAKAPASNKAPSGPRTAPNSGTGPVRSGGGLTSNKLVRPSIVTGQSNTRKSTPDAASNIGRSVGNHATESGKNLQRPAAPLYTAKKDFVEMGNKVALNVGKGGPGVGRNVYPCGSQQCPPKVEAPQSARPILSQYGPESKGGK